MHNAAFEKLGLDCVYVAFPVRDVSCVVSSLKCLDIYGLSVTAPFKETIISYLDTVDEGATEIGAVNTIRYREGIVEGINTDWIGAIRAIEKKIELAGKSCVVLGAGGTAKAVIYGLKQKKARVVVLNRTKEKAKELSEKFDTDYGSLDKLKNVKADVIINTTTVGMEPLEEVSLVPEEILTSVSVVMDVVYKPRITKLLADAQKAGCKIVEGLEMLLEQGIAQFEWWTGKKAPEECMAKAIGLVE